MMIVWFTIGLDGRTGGRTGFGRTGPIGLVVGTTTGGRTGTGTGLGTTTDTETFLLLMMSLLP
jgi:hypothetical protein